MGSNPAEQERRILHVVVDAVRQRDGRLSLPLHPIGLSLTPGQLKRTVVRLLPDAQVGVRRGVVSLKLTDLQQAFWLRKAAENLLQDLR